MHAKTLKSSPPTSHLTPHTSHLTPHTSHLTPHTSHLTPHTSHLTPHASHLTPHASHLTPHTSHLTPSFTTLIFRCTKFSSPEDTIELLCVTSHYSPEFCAGNEAWWRNVDIIGAKFGDSGRRKMWCELRKRLGFLRTFHQNFVEGEWMKGGGVKVLGRGGRGGG